MVRGIGASGGLEVGEDLVGDVGGEEVVGGEEGLFGSEEEGALVGVGGG